MTPAEFESRLMQCLDERRDPFLDAELADHLATDPEAAVRVADLLTRLDAVGAVAPSPFARRRIGVAVAAAVALVAISVLASRGLEPEPAGRVLRATLQPLDGARPPCVRVTVRTVLAAERGLVFETFDQRTVSR